MNDTSRPLLSLVVPLRDEEESLGPLVGEIEEAFAALPGPCEAILVDDGSRDTSWPKIVELSRGRPWLKGLRFLGNRGQTAAMAAGLAEARGELVAFCDADLQNDPRDLAALAAPVLSGEADVACGYRERRQDGWLLRRLPSLFANLLIRRLLRLDLRDIGCTLKVFRRAFVEDLHLFGEMHRFLPAFAQAQGARVVERPVFHRARRFGESKYGLGRVGKVLVDLLTVKLLNTYGATPAYLFGKIALVFFLAGTAAFLLTAYRALALGRVQATPVIFVMVLLYVAAMVALMSGLLAEVSLRILHEVGGRSPYRIVERAGGAAGADGPRASDSGGARAAP